MALQGDGPGYGNDSGSEVTLNESRDENGDEENWIVSSSEREYGYESDAGAICDICVYA